MVEKYIIDKSDIHKLLTGQDIALDKRSKVRAFFVEIQGNPTNGDMIKALFPDAEFDNAMPFTDGRWETMNLDTENRTRATYKPTQLRTYVDWWNAPYKAERVKKDESNND